MAVNPLLHKDDNVQVIGHQLLRHDSNGWIMEGYGTQFVENSFAKRTWMHDSGLMFSIASDAPK